MNRTDACSVKDNVSIATSEDAFSSMIMEEEETTKGQLSPSPSSTSSTRRVRFHHALVTDVITMDDYTCKNKLSNTGSSSPPTTLWKSIRLAGRKASKAADSTRQRSLQRIQKSLEKLLPSDDATVQDFDPQHLQPSLTDFHKKSSNAADDEELAYQYTGPSAFLYRVPQSKIPKESAHC